MSVVKDDIHQNQKTGKIDIKNMKAMMGVMGFDFNKKEVMKMNEKKYVVIEGHTIVRGNLTKDQARNFVNERAISTNFSTDDAHSALKRYKILEEVETRIDRVFPNMYYAPEEPKGVISDPVSLVFIGYGQTVLDIYRKIGKSNCNKQLFDVEHTSDGVILKFM